tara:strand:- start:13813 stop:14805 length:993 start_codon:yes stop_codon:yes gene_type:complete
MNFIDNKYINTISTRLEFYKVKDYNPFRANFRCPYCGDSKKSKTKTRGWILEKSHDVTVYYCHNCNVSVGLSRFLKYIDPLLQEEYLVDRKLNSLSSNPKIIEPKQDKFKVVPLPNIKLKKISQLSPDHPAKKYIVSRQIPSNTHYQIYYTSRFVEWSCHMGKVMDIKEHPRIVIPFFDKDNKIFGYSGRSLNNKSMRYITVMLDNSKPKIFGLNTVNFNRIYYITEGAIDSLFLDNAVAMVGASLDITILKNIHNAVFVYDNEPRNLQIIENMEKCIDNGYKVCIFPDELVEKDINDMCLKGLDYKSIIRDNTYDGLLAETRLSEWRRV